MGINSRFSRQDCRISFSLIATQQLHTRPRKDYHLSTTSSPTTKTNPFLTLNMGGCGTCSNPSCNCADGSCTCVSTR